MACMENPCSVHSFYLAGSVELRTTSGVEGRNERSCLSALRLYEEPVGENKMLAKVGLITFVVFGTILALVLCSYLWAIVMSHGAQAVDIGLLLRSPLYWLMVAVILFAAGWVVKRWVFA